MQSALRVLEEKGRAEVSDRSGSIGSDPTASASNKVGAAIAGPTAALASGIKIKAAPKPEKPRAMPAMTATMAAQVAAPMR